MSLSQFKTEGLGVLVRLMGAPDGKSGAQCEF